MAGRTSASSARHDTRASSTAKSRRKLLRQHRRPARASDSSPAVEPDAQEESIARDAETEVWDVRTSERDSTFDRTSNELGDIERADESDHFREDSDIERAH